MSYYFKMCRCLLGINEGINEDIIGCLDKLYINYLKPIYTVYLANFKIKHNFQQIYNKLTEQILVMVAYHFVSKNQVIKTITGTFFSYVH